MWKLLPVFLLASVQAHAFSVEQLQHALSKPELVELLQNKSIENIQGGISNRMAGSYGLVFSFREQAPCIAVQGNTLFGSVDIYESQGNCR